jgi:protein MpaA
MTTWSLARRASVLLVVATTAVACDDTRSSDGTQPLPATTTIASTTTTAPATTSSTTTTTLPPTTTSTLPPTTTAPPATVPPTTVPPTLAPSGQFLGEEVIGTSVGGRPIVVSHYGTPGGTPILVVGVIHGNENAGLAILDALRQLPVPGGYDLWQMDAMNPDGVANDVRGNENGVDLNRNFPHDWTQIGTPGVWEYSGTGPASEPETKAFIEFANRIDPALTLWYHQDLNRLSPSSRSDGPLRERYAALTGLPIIPVTGGTYTGVAATWVRNTVPSAMSFIIELGPTLSADEAAVHARAVLDVMTMV